MTYKTLLVHVTDDARSPLRLDIAQGLARDFAAHVAGLAVLPPPMLPPAYGEAITYVGPELIEAQRAAAQEQARRLRAGFEAACGRAGIAAEWREEEGGAPWVVARHARYADLAVLGQSEASGLEALGEQLPERVILAGGCPVLVVPHAGSFTGMGEHLLVAWNGSRESARAVRDALPLLKRARQVSVLEIDPADEQGQGAVDIAAALARHGVKASAEHTAARDVPVGDALLSHLADRGCDGLVMGAYGHSRLRELVLGGATRTILERMTVPVLLAC